ncbi:hypothetical protein RI138_17690 [Streptomyces sp. C11-1]|uniref:Lipoprotein n=1 Tax=Streptomyces durocortorensis TaxID=2811104 RepID=A0ABY9VX87_9ACTN|nr:hypothetical protein [Streptomyces durocortorensis]WNF28520.1 hypothetical protein RI138_17690 [Streptomyces durocortorensis]
MITTAWIALLALAVLLASAAAAWHGTSVPRRQKRSRIRRALFLPLNLNVVLVLALTACGGATSEKTVRRLADSPEAVKARQESESWSRKSVAAWDTDTPLTLGLVVLEDVCVGGQAKEWFFVTGDDQYKVNCTMRVTAYFGADPHRTAETIDGILTAGDRAESPIPFAHDFQYARKVVDYYRGKTGDPQGTGTGEPRELFAAATIRLTWDQVRSGDTRELIEEPRPCASPGPTMRRCLHEPPSTSVADLRREYGMVFKLTLPTQQYFTVGK